MNCTQFETDEDYVKAIRAGGRQNALSVDCLYRSYSDKVVNQLQRYVGYRSRQRDYVQDLAQDAFIILEEKVRLGGYNDGSLLHFWIGIAKGLLRNKIKKDSKTSLVDDTLQFDKADGESPESLLVDQQTAEILDVLLDKLGPRCKEVLTLWSRSYSMREIKELVGFSSEAMARKTKFKCKQKLIDLLDSTHIEF